MKPWRGGRAGYPAAAVPIGWNRPRAFAAAVLLLLLLLGAAGAREVDRRLRENLGRWATQRVTLMATQAVVDAVDELGAAQGVSGAQLVRYRADAAGQIVGIEYDWATVNRLIAAASRQLERRLEQTRQEELAVPLGVVSGLEAVAARGPSLRVRLLAAGSFEIAPFSEFSQAGFNQTLHRLGLEVRVQVRLVAPLLGEDARVVARVPVVENQVLGRVPAFLWQSGGQGGG